jgi:hypothetical protein
MAGDSQCQKGDTNVKKREYKVTDELSVANSHS